MILRLARLPLFFFLVVETVSAFKDSIDILKSIDETYEIFLRSSRNMVDIVFPILGLGSSMYLGDWLILYISIGLITGITIGVVGFDELFSQELDENFFVLKKVLDFNGFKSDVDQFTPKFGVFFSWVINVLGVISFVFILFPLGLAITTVLILGLVVVISLIMSPFWPVWVSIATIQLATGKFEKGKSDSPSSMFTIGLFITVVFVSVYNKSSAPI